MADFGVSVAALRPLHERLSLNGGRNGAWRHVSASHLLWQLDQAFPFFEIGPALENDLL